MGDDGGGDGLLLPVIVGGVVLGYVYRKELGIDEIYDNAILYVQKLLGLDGGGPTPCTKTCPAGQHLDTANCTCVPDTCTKTCPTGQHVNSACQCVADLVCNGKTCPTGQVLNPNDCTCETIGGGNINTSFAAAADWGSGRNNNWQKVVSRMSALKPNAILVPGDMSYTDVNGFKKVTDAMKQISPRPTILGAEGNHDSDSYGSLFDGFSNSVKTVGNVSFMMLDSNSTSSAVNYAKANMNQMTAKWKVVFMHHPVYTVKSDHGATMGSIQSTLAAGGVQLCIAAHNHNYQRFAPIGGVTHIVSGCGGEGAYSVGSYSGTPANVKKYNSKFGTFFAQTSSSSMACKFVDVDGGTVDSFTI